MEAERQRGGGNHRLKSFRCGGLGSFLPRLGRPSTYANIRITQMTIAKAVPVPTREMAIAGEYLVRILDPVERGARSLSAERGVPKLPRLTLEGERKPTRIERCDYAFCWLPQFS